MLRNTSRVSGKRAASDKDRTPVALVLAGFTAFVILALFGLAVLATVRSGGSTESFTPNDQGLIPVGEKAPDFTAETVDGGSVSLGGDASATMLVFFASWCPHCQNEAPVISELESQYEDLRVIMVGIDSADDPQTVREFVDRFDIESPATYQPSVGQTYRVSGYPTPYVGANENAEVVGAHSGEAPREVYEQWIEEAL